MTDDERELLMRHLQPQPGSPELTDQEQADALELLFVDPDAKALAQEIAEQSKRLELDDFPLPVNCSPVKFNDATLNGLFEDDKSVEPPNPVDPDDLIEEELSQTLLEPSGTRQKIEFLLGAIAGVLVLLILGSWIF